MSTQDQQFFDTFTLVMGGLVAVAVAILILALFEGGDSQREARMADTAYQEQVLARIRPLGRVRLPGDEADAAQAAVSVTAAQPVATVKTGPQVYNEACVACHGNGIGGAPKLGDSGAWAPRIAQGLPVIQGHALEGYTGDLGYMPPKGGRVDLSDEEILGAVDYMLQESG
ncbi:MAG: c-type cytochrome [Gammaproteobacteria bacterium]